MVWTILPPCTHWDAHTHKDACARTHTRSATIIWIDNARNLLRSGLNRDLCVRRLSLSSLFLCQPVVCLLITLVVSRNLSHARSPCYFILPAQPRRHTLPFPFLPQVPNWEPAPTYLLTFYHWVDTADFNQTVTHSPASFILFFIFWR